MTPSSERPAYPGQFGPKGDDSTTKPTQETRGPWWHPATADAAAPPTSEVGDSWWRPVSARTAATSAPAIADSIARVPFIALLVFTAFLFLAPQSFFPALQPLRLPFVAGSFALGSYFLDRLLRGAPLSIRLPELAILGALLAWSVLTLPVSLWPSGSVHMILDTYLKSLAIFFLLVNLVVTPIRLRRMAWFLTLLSLPLAATTLANYHFEVVIGGGNNRVLGYQGTLSENPNDLAFLLNITLPVAGGLLLAERRRWAGAVILAIMAVDVAAVIVTFSRAGFLVLAVAIVLFSWKLARRGRTKLAVVLAIAALACGPLLPASYLQRIGTSFDKEADTTGSSEARWSLIQGAVGHVMQHPVAGAGIGVGMLAMNEQFGVGVWRQVHNTYLEYAVELGLPGFALLVLLLTCALNGTLSAQRHLQRTRAPLALVLLQEGVQVSLIAFAIGALFAPGAYGWLLHYAVGLAVASRVACAAWRAPTTNSLSLRRPP